MAAHMGGFQWSLELLVEIDKLLCFKPELQFKGVHCSSHMISISAQKLLEKQQQKH